MTRFRPALLAFALVALNACVHTGNYRDVSFDALVARPWEYDGEPVRVRGYMVSLRGGIQVLEPTWADCYGGESERRYVSTTLPPSRLGRWTGSHSELDGRLVTVVGIFNSSSRPWPDYRNFATPPEYEVVGPIRHARIEAIADQRCRRIDER